MLVAVIDAQGQGTIIKVVGLPDEAEDEDLADALVAQDFDRKCIMLDDLPASVATKISRHFVTYRWADGALTEVAPEPAQSSIYT